MFLCHIHCAWLILVIKYKVLKELIFFLKPLFATMDVSNFRDKSAHFRNSGVKGFDIWRVVIWYFLVKRLSVALATWMYQNTLIPSTRNYFEITSSLSIPMDVDDLRVWYWSGSTLWKVMDWSNAIFHGLLNIIITKYQLSHANLTNA